MQIAGQLHASSLIGNLLVCLLLGVQYRCWWNIFLRYGQTFCPELADGHAQQPRSFRIIHWSHASFLQSEGLTVSPSS